MTGGTYGEGDFNGALKSGTVKWDASLKELTFDNAVIEANASSATGLSVYSDNVRLKLIGKNSLKGNMYLSLYWFGGGNAKIYSEDGTGELTLEGYSGSTSFHLPTYAGSSMDIKDCWLNIKGGRAGISGSQWSSTPAHVLNIDNSEVHITSTTNGALYYLEGLNLTGCEITSPGGAAFADDLTGRVSSSSGTEDITVKGVGMDGEPVKELHITRTATADYHLTVAGISVTNKNAFDIAGDGISGKVSYNPLTQTLNLDNATIATEGNVPPVRNDNLFGGTLTLNVTGTNTLSNTDNGQQSYRGGGWIWSNLAITGSGTLNVNTADNAVGFEIYKWDSNPRSLLVKDCSLNINSVRQCIEGASGGEDGVDVTIDHASVNLTCTSEYDVIENMRSWTLTNCAVTESSPEGNVVRNDTYRGNLVIEGTTTQVYHLVISPKPIAGETVTAANGWIYKVTGDDEAMLINARTPWPDGIVEIPAEVRLNNYDFNVTAIGGTGDETGGAFYQCYKLKGVTIPEGVTTITDYAFSDCTQLRNANLSIPSTLTTIGTGAFRYCHYIQPFFPSTVTTLGNSAFEWAGSNLSDFDLTIPATITTMGTYVFRYCHSIKTVDLSAYTLSALPSGTFSYCSRLESIELPSSIKLIGSHSLRGTALKSIKFDEGVESLGAWAFYGCTQLEEVELPAGMTEVGSYNFNDCAKLKRVIFNNPNGNSGVVNYNTFAGCSALEGIYVPYTGIASYKTNGNLTEKKSLIAPWVRPAKEFTTFACTEPVDFSAAEGLKAYYAKELHSSGSKVLMAEAEKGKAGEGYVLQATAGERYFLGVPADDVAAPATNLLVGVTANTDITATDGDKTNFLLSDGEFKKANAGTLAGGKAYLQLTTADLATANLLTLDFGDGTTAIIGLDGQVKTTADGAWYTLNGQRVERPAQKGIYILNGRKVVVK